MSTETVRTTIFEPGPEDPAQEEEQPTEVQDGTLLFSLGDKHFYMPDQIPPNIAFKFLRDRRREDQTYAVAGLIENLLGPKALDALADADDMSGEDMKTLMKIINDKVMGKLEEAMNLGN